MKITLLVPLVTVLCTPLTWAVDAQSAGSQLQGYPKNLARQHVGTNLFVYDSSNASYIATEASSAWLDDDVSTGWPVLAGKQHYLLVLTEPEQMAGFSISARPASGTVSLYSGDEPAAPGAKSWLPMAKDMPVDSINQKQPSRSFGRLAKYVLIETDIAEPGPVYSLYLYSEKPATSYTLHKREQPIDARAVFGPYVSDQNSFSVSGLYAAGRVTYANSSEGFTPWQRSIDDNPATDVKIAATSTEAGAVISFGEPRSVSRVAILTDPSAKGQLDFYVIKSSQEGGANERKGTSLAGMTAAASVVFDGTTQRAAVDLPATEGSSLAMRWSPISISDTLTIREVNAFAGLTMNDYEVSGTLSTVADVSDANGFRTYDAKSGKDFIDPKKNPEDPIAAGPGSPYNPGALGFPANRSARLLPAVEPESN